MIRIEATEANNAKDNNHCKSLISMGYQIFTHNFIT